MAKETMKMREGGKEHEIGNVQCPACNQTGLSGQPLDNVGTQFPYPCPSPNPPCDGLVHAEVFPDERGGASSEYRCDRCGGQH